MKNWIAGLLATIIAGVAIYWLTSGIDKYRVPIAESNSVTQPSQLQQTKPISDSPNPTIQATVSQKHELQVAITASTNDLVVDVYDKISGTVSDKNAIVWVVIQPLETWDCWVQKPIIVNSNGTWTASVQFGEYTPAYSGKPYEVRAFANPHPSLSPGRTTCWPKADARSDALYVKRR